ncbi:hypothetical protein TIFTF001_023618 [Ficus carica]|uniref:Uncharacterized protein n=1 Tax=Ficus carica TaxID=3494 RepID=A0AA88B065_FICCA|nr:hypothetical protein TIFTF001_023618 [Ficus carica]
MVELQRGALPIVIHPTVKIDCANLFFFPSPIYHKPPPCGTFGEAPPAPQWGGWFGVGGRGGLSAGIGGRVGGPELGGFGFKGEGDSSTGVRGGRARGVRHRGWGARTLMSGMKWGGVGGPSSGGFSVGGGGGSSIGVGGGLGGQIWYVASVDEEIASVREGKGRGGHLGGDCSGNRCLVKKILALGWRVAEGIGGYLGSEKAHGGGGEDEELVADGAQSRRQKQRSHYQMVVSISRGQGLDETKGCSVDLHLAKIEGKENFIEVRGLALPRVCNADNKWSWDYEISSRSPSDHDRQSWDRELSVQPPLSHNRRSRDHKLLLRPPPEFELARP